jgi:hypothetical protein
MVVFPSGFPQQPTIIVLTPEQSNGFSSYNALDRWLNQYFTPQQEPKADFNGLFARSFTKPDTPDTFNQLLLNGMFNPTEILTMGSVAAGIDDTSLAQAGLTNPTANINLFNETAEESKILTDALAAKGVTIPSVQPQNNILNLIQSDPTAAAKQLVSLTSADPLNTTPPPANGTPPSTVIPTDNGTPPSKLPPQVTDDAPRTEEVTNETRQPDPTETEIANTTKPPVSTPPPSTAPKPVFNPEVEKAFNSAQAPVFGALTATIQDLQSIGITVNQQDLLNGTVQAPAPTRPK